MNDSLLRFALCTTLAVGGVLPLGVALAEHPASPRGQSAAQVAGKVAAGKNVESVGFSDGKWLEVDYGRPLLRGRRNIFGSGANYGKDVDSGAPVWRAGANETTRLKIEAPLVFGDKKIAPGEYDLFVDLKDGAWTLIISTQPAQTVGGPKAKGKMWGSYGYDPKFDVARVPMTMSKSEASIEQFTIGFLDVSAKGGKLEMAWEYTVAVAPFVVAE